MTANWPKIAGYLAALIAFGLYSCSERRAGRLDEQIMNLERQHRADSLVADSAIAIAQNATKEAETLRAKARAEVERDRAAQRITDSIMRESSNERSQAEQLLADSSATLGELRGEIGRLVSRGRADSVAAANKADRQRRTMGLLLDALQSDSTAIQKGIEATNAALKRAVSAEKEVNLLQHRGGGWRGQVIAAGITYGACRLLVRCN